MNVYLEWIKCDQWYFNGMNITLIKIPHIMVD